MGLSGRRTGKLAQTAMPYSCESEILLVGIKA